MENQHNNIRVLMFPWLAHGHISPFLELAKKLSERNFSISLCSTPVNLSSIKQKLGDKSSLSIQLVEFHLSTPPDLPPHYHTTQNLPPHLMPTLKKALDTAAPNFSNILKTLNPDLLIYDVLIPWASEIASKHNIPAVEFISTSATTGSFMVHLFKNPGKDFPFSTIYPHDHENAQVTHLQESSGHSHRERDRAGNWPEQASNIVLIKTFREIEEKYIDYLSVLLEKKIVPVGPLVQDPVEVDKDSSVLEWLNKKNQCSTVFVSFGTEYFPSKENMEEIAHGLELSNVNFIWVVRFPVGEKIRVEEALPGGFLDRVGERGMVVEGWAPQAKILGHSSIGGFVSHCGWSSVLESMKYGVPIIAIPMQLDQPLNARLLVEVGVAVEVVRDEDGKLERDNVATAIKQVVVVVEETGEDIRRKARELSEKIKMKGEEERHRAVEELAQLCRKWKRI